jgi:hypothetical protein
VSYRKEKVSTESSDSSTSKVKKKTSHSLSDFLTGSPLKTADKDKDKVKEKKEKKHGKFHISSPLKAHKSKSGESPKSGSKSSASSDNGVDEMKMAAEVSRRSEDERRRKLQLQEEADLAYAIALSKAEAASLKSQ